MSAWRPSTNDVAWARQMVRINKDGANWVIPSSDLVYRFNHKQKRLTLVHGRAAQEVHRMNVVVFGRIGYTVTVEIEADTPEMIRAVQLGRIIPPGITLFLCD